MSFKKHCDKNAYMIQIVPVNSPRGCGVARPGKTSTPQKNQNVN